MAAEKSLQDAVMELLARTGWIVLRINQGRKGKISFGYWMGRECKKHSSGMPDVVAYRGDRYLLLEIKGAGGTVRDSQVQFAQAALLAGVVTYTIYSLEDLQTVLANGIDK